MTSLPMVSIVIPVYNGSDYLAEAVDSALAQTYPNIEVLVINDGSDDGGKTESIIESYGPRIRSVSQPNGGVASALNTGIRAMRGDYFSWLSHDDLYPPYKIEVQMEYALRSPRNTIFYGNFEAIDKVGRSLEKYNVPHVSPLALRPSLMLNASVHGCSLLIPKQVFDEVGVFDESLRTTQDYDLWFRMAARFPFEHIHKILVLSRIHENQGTNFLKDQVVRDVNRLYRRYLRTLSTEEIVAFWPTGIFDYLMEASKSMNNRGYRSASAYALFMAFRNLDPGRSREVWRQAVALLKESVTQCTKNKARRMLMIFNGLISRFRRSRVGTALTVGQGRAAREIFKEIYHSNYWGNSDSRSGGGSDLDQTKEIRRCLPELLKGFNIRTMIDIPCGDWHWMKEVPLDIDYLGADIVPELIQRNQELYGNDRRRFMTLDLTKDKLPGVDLVFSRDVLVHLSFEDVITAFHNIKRSGSKYFLTTTFTARDANIDIPTGHWRPLNLQKAPFNLPEPLMIINENCTEGDGSWGDKSLGLWRVRDLCEGRS